MKKALLLFVVLSAVLAPMLVSCPNAGISDGGKSNGGNTVTYTVTFQSRGGSAVPSQSVQSGGKATRPADDPQLTEYIFENWYSDAGFQTVYDFAQPVTQNITLYAQWRHELKSVIESGTVPADLSAYGALVRAVLEPYTPSAAIEVRYVDVAEQGNGDASSWEHAAGDIKATVDGIGDAGANKIYLVLAASGTHTSPASIAMKNHVAIVGGWNEWEQTGASTISGEDTRRVFDNNGIDRTALLYGVTIAHGNSSNENGGGMNNQASSPTLSTVTFAGNKAMVGGGMANNGNSLPVLSNVTFVNNKAISGSGGGLYNENSSPTLSNVTFSGNTADTSGGGMANENSSPAVINVTFVSNEATVHGGGMLNNNDGGEGPTIVNTLFWENTGGASRETAGQQIYMFNGGSGAENITISFSLVQHGIGATTSATADTDPSDGLGIGGGSALVTVSQSTNIIGDPMVASELADNGGSVETIALLDNSAAANAGAYVRRSGTPGSFTFYYSTDSAEWYDNPVITGASVPVSVPADALELTATDARGYERTGRPDIGAYEGEGVPANSYTVTFDSGGGNDVSSQSVQVNARASRPANPVQAGYIFEDWYSDAGFQTIYNFNQPVTGDITLYAGWIEAEKNLKGVISAGIIPADLSAYDTLVQTVLAPYAPGASIAARYVDVAERGTGDALSWANAAGDIKATVDGIGDAGANTVYLVLVASGTHTLPASIAMKNHVAIVGGWNEWEQSGASAISGEDTRRVFDNDGIDRTALLYGVTITQGNTGSDGGGMSNTDASPTLSNVTFFGNKANAGGGMANSNSSPILVNVTFSGNEASDAGGGMINDSSSSPALINVTFAGNTANQNGGGMTNGNGSSPTIVNTLFWGNTGGASTATAGQQIYLSNAGSGAENITISFSLVQHGIAATTGVTADSDQSDGLGIGGGTELVTVTQANIISSDPKLAADLADNGGVVQTIALLDSSAAANKGAYVQQSGTTPPVTFYYSTDTTDWYNNPIVTSTSVPVFSVPADALELTAADARGYERNGRPDIGAYEGDSASIYYTVTFDSGAGNAVASQNVESGRQASRPADPQRPAEPEYIFENWYSDANFQTIYNFNQPVTGDITLYARWIEAEKNLKGVIDTGVVPADLSAYGALAQTVLAPYTANAAIVARYVDVTTQGTGDALSWANAAGDIKTTVDGIGDAGANKIYLVLVASGTHTPTDTLAMKNHVAIVGGWNEWEQSGISTISGEDARGVFDNSGIDRTALLYGVTITQGNSGSDGGGMRNTDASPTLNNVIFDNNEANRSGGGMYNIRSNPSLNDVTFSGNTASGGGGMRNINASPTLRSVTFVDNRADNWGGGMANQNSLPTLNNVTFSGNEASYGGGMFNDASSPDLSNVSFVNNRAVSGGHGGGMRNTNSSSPTLSNVTFSGNTADQNGGGMANSASSSPVLSNVTFSGNEAPYGGGMRNSNSSSPTLSNVTFSGNTGEYGGGMYNWDNSSPTLINATFAENTANQNGGGVYNNNDGASPAIVNTLFWNNTGGGSIATAGQQIYMHNDGANGENITISFSLVQHGIAATAGVTADADQSDGLGISGGSAAVNVTQANNISSNPMLAADLADNSGFVQTIALLDNSAAANKGAYVQRSGTAGSFTFYYSEDNTNWFSDAVLSSSGTAPPTDALELTAADARGYARNGRPDIGAYEGDSASIYYTVTFDSGAGNAVASQNVESGREASRPADPQRPAEPEYIFENWYSDAGFQTVYNFDQPVTRDMTLYAQWMLITYTVTFDSGAGSDVPSQSVQSGGKASRPADPQRPGYIFENWYSDASFQTVYNFDQPVTGSITLYARWIAVVTYTVTFDSGEGSAVSPQSVQSGGKATRPADPQRPGYSFDNWYTDAGFQTVYNFDQPVTGSITLYAQWIEEEKNLKGIIDAGVIPADLETYDTLVQTVLAPYAANAAIVARYVDVTAQGAGDASSWANAAGDIKTTVDGIADAEANKIYLVLVASGTHVPAATLAMKNHVAIVGGWNEWEQTGASTISGDNARQVFSNNGIDRTALLYGVTIANANGNNSGSLGGGMANENSSPTLINITFSGNTTRFGGGMYNSNSSPTLINVTFVNNESTNGGGMYNRSSSSPTLINVTFVNNESTNDGGAGMFNNNDGGEGPTIVNTLFWENTGGVSQETAEQQIYMFNYGTEAENMTISFSLVQHGIAATTSATADTDPSDGLGIGGGSELVTVSQSTNISGDPKLAADLADNGGFVQTIALLDNSAAANAGAYIQRSGTAGSFTFYYSEDNANWFSDAVLSSSGTAPPTDALDLTATDARGYARNGRPDIGAYEGDSASTYYTVTFDSGAGSDVPSQSVQSGGKASRPADPQRPGYSFVNWYSDTGFQTVYNFDQPVTGSITLYAQWIEAEKNLKGIIDAGVIPADLSAYGALVQTVLGPYAADAAIVARYVDVTAQGAGDASSWANAAGDIKTTVDGIADAEANKIYLVLLASGTHAPAATLAMKNHVAIVGGWNEWEQAGASTISGEDTRQVFNNNGINRTALLYGVTIANGNSGSNAGGGMANLHASPTLNNVTFVNNESTNGGGGMYNASSTPTLINVTFVNNKARGGSRGGGMVNQSNSSSTLINVTFVNNDADDIGGGMYNDNDGREGPTIVNTLFWNNKNRVSSETIGQQIYMNNDGSTWHENMTISFSLVQHGIAATTNATDDDDATDGLGISGGAGSSVTVTQSNNISGDPKLAADLADNGGSVQTIALLDNSAAADAGAYVKRSWETPPFTFYYSADAASWFSDAVLSSSGSAPPADALDLTATDARGYARSGRPDIGAYEYGGTVTYTVTFASGEGSDVPSQSVQSGGKASRPADPQRPGYFFENWYSDATFQTVYNFDQPVTGSITLYARWIAVVTYTVTFDSGEGSAVSPQSVQSGGKATRPADPQRPGYSFDNWYSDAGFQTVYNFDQPVTGDMTLYAQWLHDHELKSVIESGTVPADLDTYGSLVRAVLEPYAAGAAIVARYVDVTARGNGDASSWANAAGDIKTTVDGIADAEANKIYLVLLASGTHVPAATLAMKDHVAIVGGWKGWGQSGTSTISGEDTRRVFHNSGIDRTALLYGVTIANGKTAGTGGGMDNWNSSPTLNNVTFVNNEAIIGGGMYNSSSSPTLINVTFSGNRTTQGFLAGGGMANENNSSPVLSNVTFVNNEAYLAGGMYNVDSSPVLINVTFADNKSGSTTAAGGMYNDNSSPVLSNVTFVNNKAGSDGGGMFNQRNSLCTLINVTFVNNEAGRAGGGMLNDGEGGEGPTIVNALFWNNTGGASQATAGHQIFMWNTGSEAENMTISFSLVQHGIGATTSATADTDQSDGLGIGDGSASVTVTQSNNISGDPKLAADLADNGGFVQTIALLDNSAAANAGAYVQRSGTPGSFTFYYSEDNADWFSDAVLSSSGPAPPVDALDLTAADARGYARNGRPDIGAYEYGGTAP